MTGRRLLGLVLIVIGVLALAWQGVSYTRRKEIFHVGPFQATTERRTIPISPVIGAVALGGGLVLVAGSRRTL